MGRVARALLAGSVWASLTVAACGSRTGLLGPTPEHDASLDVEDAPIDVIEAGEEAEGIMPLCTPRTCSQMGWNCGVNGDGCGHTIDCGTCPEPQICGANGFSRCGGGFGLGPDGAPLCTPETCQSLNIDCGPAGDGCGGVLFCGSCQAPLICGGAGTPGRCGSSCTGLCQQQVQCESGTTTVSGTVVAGTLPQFGVPDPIYDAVVYVPNAKVQPFVPGVACNQCGQEISGNPLVETKTGPDGTFVLQNVPVGANIPLVIQLGRWRRQVTIPSVAACTNTALPPDLTRMPRNQSEGDIPLTAIATGLADAIECVLMKMGVDQSEFTLPSGNGRVHIYQMNGAWLGPSTPNASTLWDNPAELSKHDIVLLPCEGMPNGKSTTEQQNLIAYSSAGGRVFTTHYGYTWLYDDPPFQGTANWNPNFGAADAQAAIVDTSFKKGQDFAAWLGNVGALSGPGQITLYATRHDLDSVNPPSEQFIYATGPQQTLHYDFYTPVGQPLTQQCGRVTYSDFHVNDQQLTTNVTFPSECDALPMTAQEKALEFTLFDLASCVPAPPPPCQPLSCAQQGFNCGPQGDGCGGEIMCGSCMAPDTCGGGGVPGRCGYPDAGNCIPKTCSQLGYDCGTNGDGCGHTINCGTCTPPAICGGGGQPSVCGI